jgi:putative ABC transport system substrate-binding protein
MKHTVGVVAAWAMLSSFAMADNNLRLRTIGELWFQDANGAAIYHDAFNGRLRDLGYVDGENVSIVTRFANGDMARLPELLAELLALHVEVMYVNAKAVPIAKQATSAVPIVSVFFDPVAEGLVESLARPGGNITGMSWQSVDAVGKRLQLTVESVPALKHIALLFDPGDRGAVLDADAFRKAALESQLLVSSHTFRNSIELTSQLAAIEKERAHVLVVVHNPLTVEHRAAILRFSARSRTPVVSEGSDWGQAGALLSYGPSVVDVFRRCADYVDKILKGVKPADLPIEQPKKFVFVINARTAKALGIRIPESVLVRADEVIR